MATHLLSCELSVERVDVAVGLCARWGMLGCEEKEGAREDTVRLEVWFPEAGLARAAAEDLSRLGGEASGVVSRVEDRDWNAVWRASLQPVLLTERIWVSPRWLPPPCGDTSVWIRIEPRMAFGSGHHPSTRLAAIMLCKIVGRGVQPAVLDVGAGSGVLSFAAAVAGSGCCVGVETDATCLRDLAENRRDNPQYKAVSFIIGTIAALKATARFDAAVMNLLLTEGAPCLACVARLVSAGGALVWSGLLTTDRDAAVQAAASHGFTIQDELAEEEWICCSFERR